MTQINWNGELYDAEAAVLNVQNRAFRYGDGIFETIYYDRSGSAPLWHWHQKRIKRSLRCLAMQEQRADCLWDELTKLCRADTSYRVRITIVRKTGGLYAPEQMDFDFLIEAIPFEDSLFELTALGAKVGICDEVRLVFDKYSALKRTSALSYVMASQVAKQKGWNEVLLLNSQERICESSKGNLFFLDNNGNWHTPPLSEGCIAGVCRASLLEAIPNVLQTPLTQEAWQQTEAAFVSNALRGIQILPAPKQNKAAGKLLAIKKIHQKWINFLKKKVSTGLT